MIVYEEMDVRAYSPNDAIDAAYHATHTNKLTSRGNDSSLPGIASKFPRNTKCIVPGYNGDAPTICDDSGAALRKRTDLIEVRFQSEEEAKKWGVKKLLVEIIYP